MTRALLRVIDGFCLLMAHLGRDQEGGWHDRAHRLFMRICDWRDPERKWVR